PRRSGGPGGAGAGGCGSPPRAWPIRPKGRGMPTGTISRLLRDRGFGFIREETGPGTELLFHRTATAVPFEELREGQRVAFEVEPDPRGRGDRAVRVALAPWPGDQTPRAPRAESAAGPR